MKKNILIIIIIAVLCLIFYGIFSGDEFGEGKEYDIIKTETLQSKQEIQEGDIIFQTSKSSQSQAIQLATDSKYSHMGIIFEKDGKQFVYEAIQSVQFTALDKWIKRGENKHYVIKRLKNSDNFLTLNILEKMKLIGKRFEGKKYDIYFEWSDEAIYCSELVWKIYKEALGIEIGKLEKLSDFDLSHDVVKEKMIERYGNNIPDTEQFISPAAMFNSRKLFTIENEK
ncbi:MAG: hypothetical protein ACI94Y_004059 [Maribacter sp.]|jgi:uncharacterized protein YycO